MPKTSVGESFTVAIISGIEKFWIRGGGSIKIFRGKIFCLTVPKVSVGGSFTVALISGIEKFWIREGGVSRFSVENFLSHSAEIFRRGSLYCCNNFRYRKKLDKTGGSFKIFRGKIFCLTVPRDSVGESFTVALISGIEKFWIREGGSIKIFSQKFFCLTVPKNFVGQSFTVAIISGIGKIWMRGGGEYQDFPRKFFCLTVPKNLVGEPFCAVFQFGKFRKRKTYG